MEDILQALNDIARILDESQNPTWLLYLSALGPLIDPHGNFRVHCMPAA